MFCEYKKNDLFFLQKYGAETFHEVTLDVQHEFFAFLSDLCESR